MYVVCVVVLVNKKPREYKNFYLSTDTVESANVMMKAVATKGFKSGDERFFPDQIESITFKQRERVDETFDR